MMTDYNLELSLTQFADMACVDLTSQCDCGLQVPALVAGLTSDEIELQNIVVAGWRSFAPKVDITAFVKRTHWSPKQILLCVREAHYNHPEVFFLARGINLEIVTRPSGVLISAILNNLNYDQTPSEYFVHKRKLDEAVLDAMQILNGVDGELNKILQLHDYLVEVCRYDAEAREEKIFSTRARTAYSALVRRKAMCEGYTMAYRLLLNAAGIVSDVVVSKRHIWNYVRIGHHWYHVDVTWDASIIDGNHYSKSQISHEYFLMSDQKARLTHEPWRVRTGLPTAYDTCYDLSR